MKQTLLQQIEEEMARLEEEMLLGDVSTQSFDLVNNTSVQDNILSPETKVQDFGIQYKDVLGKPKKYDGILTKNDNFVVSAGMFNLKRTNESESNNDQWFDIIVNGNKVGKYGLSFYNDIKAVGIGDLEIYPEYRNKGYGTRTIKDIVSKYKNTADLIYCFVDKDNTDAIRLYKRLGTVSDKSNTSQKVGEYEWKNSNGQYYVEFYNRNKSLTKENYERPWSLEEIKMYVPDKYEELSKCPIHRWRAESGIELIHKEPTRDELDRIWKNWNLMPKEMQDISDKKSMELFGITNAENYRQLTSEIDESNEMLSEGKHWPEDYKKTAFNMIKASPLGQTTWYSNPLINLDIDTIVNEFGPLSHKNSNLGYFSTIIKWFIEYTGTNKDKYQEFIERKLDEIIQTLLYLSNNSAEEIKIKDDLKTKWKFSDFEEYAKKIQTQISHAQQEKSKNLTLVDKGYDIIPIRSYEELNEKFGGNKTGYRGQSEWCHTNGKSTYNSWTSNGTKMFFVLAKKDWENIKPPVPNTTNAYDEYGTSLIAILVDIASNKLLNATLRWNHIIEPSDTVPGTSVDKAFLGWADLAEVTGKNIEQEIINLVKKEKEELKRKSDHANEEIEEILKNCGTDITYDVITQEIGLAITHIKIPNNITIINRQAFEDCANLKVVEIPDSVTEIGEGAFANCKSLESINIPNSVKKIGNTAFGGCESLKSIEIPNSVTEIKASTFEDCDSLESITIPNSVTSIGIDAFAHCKSLKSIEIPDSVIYIKNNAFSTCRSLESIKIPNSVTSIGNSVFYACDSLKSIIIPNSITSIESCTFIYCHNLESITIPNSVTSIGSEAFQECRNLKSITIPNSVTEIDDYAFRSCKSLESITIPNSVTKIGYYAFSGCSSIKSITISDSVTKIGDCAFQFCNSLESITIPASVTNIGSMAFYNCTGLTDITISNSSTSFGTHVFKNINSWATITIPEDFDKEIFYDTDPDFPDTIEFKVAKSNNTTNESLISEDTKKCIFPVLKPELYNKLLETKLTEDESKEFDFKQFEDFINKLDVTDLASRNKVISFLQDNNKNIVFIGEGDGRIAFFISEIKGISDGNPCCLKIAKNTNGIQQNKTDSKILSDNAKYNCFPKLFKYDSNGKYEITEVGKIADKKFFQKYIQNFNKIVDKMKSTIEANIKTSDYNSLKIADYEDEEDLNDPFNYRPEEIIRIVRIFKKPKERRFKYFQDDKTYLDKFLIPLCKSHPEYSTILGLIQFALSGKMNIDLGELDREQNWAIITRNNVEIPMPIDVGFLDESQEFNSDLTDLNESDIQGFENMSLDELKDLILDGIHDRMIENNVTDYDAKILNMAIIGSRNRHTAKPDSDLDVVLEYSGEMREDDLFDVLHSETEDGEFEINGIAIDVNPIRAQQTGTLEDYLNKSKKYDEYVLSKVKLNETKKKRKKRNYRQYGAFYPYWPIFPIHPSKPDKPDSEPEDVTPDGGETDIGDIGCSIDAGGIGESEIQTNLGKILLTEATHEQAMNYMRKILKHWKTNIIEIVFTKKSTGTTRKIRVHFDEDFVKNACNGGNDEIVKQIRATNKERDNMIVCEMLPNRKYQFRTIPLRNVKSLKIKDYKTWRYTKHGDVSDINLK